MTKLSIPSIIVDSDKDWNFQDIENIYGEIERIGLDEMKLDIYPNQIEVISSEQMLDAYSSNGLPIMYNHWSFGKQFLKNRKMYERGRMGLAYEIVMNTSPCLEYIMEENSLLMQTLVIAHAGFGHNTFFKNNYMFKQWTDATNILDYMAFAKKFITKCEEKYGVANVEKILDAAHSLQNHSFFKFKRKEKLSIKEEMSRKIEKALESERSYNDLWRTLPSDERVGEKKSSLKKKEENRKLKFSLPEENILYFIETYSPKLKDWEREIVRIVRNVSQYYYPNIHTKTANEGTATAVHYHILNRLYDKGILTDGAMLEFLRSHTSVIMQPPFHSAYYSGINPYALGFAVFQDMKRICTEPTEEDKTWFPDVAGSGDFMPVWKNMIANYRDESFIRQFLSPKVIRDFKFFSLYTNEQSEYYEVKNIHNEGGYKHIRQDLANSYELTHMIPEIEVTDYDAYDTRKLILTYTVRNGKLLEADNMGKTLKNVANLWGYPVIIRYAFASGDVMKSYTTNPSDDNSIGMEENSEE